MPVDENRLRGRECEESKKKKRRKRGTYGRKISKKDLFFLTSVVDEVCLCQGHFISAKRVNLEYYWSNREMTMDKHSLKNAGEDKRSLKR